MRKWVGPDIGLLQFTNLIGLGLAYVKTQTLLRIMLGQVGSGTVVIGAHFAGRGRSIRIGRGVVIRWNTRIEAVARYAGVDLHPEITIGDGTNIEQNCHIVCGERISIGRNVSITPGCAIVDLVHPYDTALEKIGGAPVRTSPVEIGDGAMLGAGVVVLPGTKIGRRVVVGANAVVQGVLPDFTIWAGNPARCLKTYDIETLG